MANVPGGRHALSMKVKMFFLAAIFAIASGSLTGAATIPAGTVFVVRTLHAVSSVDAPGSHCNGQLAHDITVGGKVVLRAGTKFAGKVVTSRRLISRPDKLTVDMTSVHLNGHNVPISTTGAQFLSNDMRSRRDVSVSRVNYTVASGKLLQFHFARPLSL